MEQQKQTVNIIPLPQSIIENNGYFLLNEQLIIDSQQNVKNIQLYLKTFLQNQNIIAILKDEIHNQQEKELPTKLNEIHLKLVNNQQTMYYNEGYELKIGEYQIFIQANTINGLFYGIQSLKQIILTRNEHNKIPCLQITDNPQYQWRGMHLDVSRHFQPKEFIMKFIEMLAFFKLNRFHWHLTDDQGWRIEIKKYPNLTIIGSHRINSELGFTSTFEGKQQKKYVNKEHGGFYTQEDIRQIIKHADDNFITIVPEIDGPGHLQAAIASYQELGCTKKKVEVMCNWGISNQLMNLQESSFKFIEDVFTEVCELFPGKYIHIGGDEVKYYKWKQYEYLEDFMKEQGFTELEQIQGYYNKRMYQFLNQKGKILIGWDEILYNQDDCPDKIIMAWRGEQHAITAAKNQIQCIISSQRCLYFDIQESFSKDYPMSRSASKKFGLPNLQKVYEYCLQDIVTNQNQKKYIIGGQGQAWTEHMPTPQDVEFKVFPRLLALSEILWTQPSKKQQYQQFKQRVIQMCNYFDKININYCKAFLFE